MKNAILNAAKFLPAQTQKWAKENEYIFVSSLEEARSHGCERCYISFQDSQTVIETGEVSAEVRAIGTFDCLEWDGQRFWPFLAVKDDVQKLIAQNNWGLARHKPCFIWGDDLTTRWLLSFAMQAGFRQIFVFLEKAEWGASYIYPGVDIKWVKDDEIESINITGEFFLVHFESELPPATTFDAIKYMHFLNEKSYLVDLSRDSFLSAKFLKTGHYFDSAEAWRQILESRLATPLHFSSKV